MPSNASQERKKILRAYGVEFILTDPGEGSDGAIREARRLYAEEPEKYFYPDQYSNPANPRVTTSPRRRRSGSRRAVRSRTSSRGWGRAGPSWGPRAASRSTTRHNGHLVRAGVAVPRARGMKHMESAIVPPIYDPSVADENRRVSTEDAYEMVKRVAREEGS